MSNLSLLKKMDRAALKWDRAARLTEVRRLKVLRGLKRITDKRLREDLERLFRRFEQARDERQAASITQVRLTAKWMLERQ